MCHAPEISMAATMWTDDEAFLLLDLWGGDKTVQALLEGCMRNRHVYERKRVIQRKEDTEEFGASVETNFTKLNLEYKKLKDFHEETGRKRKQWQFYKKMSLVTDQQHSLKSLLIRLWK